MPYKFGFDLYPPLEHKDELVIWASFLEKVKEQFSNDSKFEVTDKYLTFKDGDHLKLPIDGTYFRRFSSELSVSKKNMAMEHYISKVLELAKNYFGRKIHFWCDKAYDEFECSVECYSLEEIETAEKAYKKLFCNEATKED